LKPAEKIILAELVGIMISFGLTYIQEKLEDGSYAWRLEP